MTLSIHSPDELIAVIPHMLGFKPGESIVLVPSHPHQGRDGEERQADRGIRLRAEWMSVEGRAARG